MIKAATKKVGLLSGDELGANGNIAGNNGHVTGNGSAGNGTLKSNNSGSSTPIGLGARGSLQRQQYRVMDEFARRRRLRQHLDQLERDNYHDDPHANLVLNKKIPRFETDTSKGGANDRRRSNLRLRNMSFVQLLEDDAKRPEPNYASAAAPPPEKFRLPKRHFCSVCGFDSAYTCVTCGSRFCCIECLKVHKDTRCLKWTA